MAQDHLIGINRCIPKNRLSPGDATISGCLSGVSFDEIVLLRDKVKEAPAEYYLNFQEARPNGDGAITELESTSRGNFVLIPLDWGVSLGSTSANIEDTGFKSEAVLNDALSVVPRGKKLASIQSINGGSKVTAHTLRNEALVVLNSDPGYKGVLASVRTDPFGTPPSDRVDPDETRITAPALPDSDERPFTPPPPVITYTYDRTWNRF